MYSGPLVFSQVMSFLPSRVFQRCVERYRGDFSVKRFSCLDQFRTMAFAQLTYRESLRDIEACLRAQSSKLYHMGIRGKVSRSTLADANETRNWRIYADLAHSLIPQARKLYLGEYFGFDLAPCRIATGTPPPRPELRGFAVCNRRGFGDCAQQKRERPAYPLLVSVDTNTVCRPAAACRSRDFCRA